MPVTFAGTVIKIDGTTVARVTRMRRQKTMNEVDVSGAEHTSGELVDKQYKPVSLDETLELEGVTVAGAGAEHEAGQAALIAAADAGSSVVIQALKRTGYGHDYTGHFTSFEEGANVEDVFKFSATFRVNSKSAVTP